MVFYDDDQMVCDSVGQISSAKVVLPLAAAISFVSYCTILLIYLLVPAVKRHPTSMVFHKCIFEFVFTTQFFWIPFVDTSFYWTDDTPGGDGLQPVCNASANAAIFAFITQATLLGGELWFLVVSVDMHVALNNPFVSYRQVQTYLYLVVYGISILSGAALIVQGPELYGLSSDGMVWIQDQSSVKSTTLQLSKATYFYAWMVFIYFYCMYVVFSVTSRIRKGLSATLLARLTVIRRARVYVAGYTLFWTTPLLAEFINLIYQQDGGVRTLGTFCLASRGVFSLAIILVGHNDEVTAAMAKYFEAPSLYSAATAKQRALGAFAAKSNDSSNDTNDGVAEKITAIEEELANRPHLNLALRMELLYYTSKGIRFVANATSDEYIRATSEFKVSWVNYVLRPTTSTVGAGVGGAGAGAGVGAAAGLAGPSNNATGASNVNNSAPASASGSVPPVRAMAGGPHGPNPNLAGGQGRGSDLWGGRMTSTGTSGMASSRHPSMSARQFLFRDVEQATISHDAPDMNNDYFSPSAGSRRAPMPFAGGKLSFSSAGHGGAAAGDLNVPLRPSEVELRDSRSRRITQDTVPRTRNSSSLQWAVNQKQRQSYISEVEAEVRESMQELGVEDEEVLARNDDDDVEDDLEGESGKKAASPYFGSSGHAVAASSVGGGPDTTQVQIPLDSASAGTAGQHSKQEEQPQKERGVQLSSTHSRIVRALSRAWFKAINTSQNTTNNYRFVDFCPTLFAHVRNLCGISPEMYSESFTSTTREQFSEGKSGAFLYYSADLKYIVKTITKAELMKLLQCLPAYVDHIATNPSTLLIKYLSAHCIVMYGQSMYFVVMNNMFSDADINERFDLKGSWVDRHRGHGRETNEFSRGWRNKSHRKFSTMSAKDRSARRWESGADQNLLYEDNDMQHKIALPREVSFNLAMRIQNDVKFLRSMNLMDYSLLVGVKYRRFKVRDTRQSSSSDTEGWRDTAMLGLGMGSVPQVQEPYPPQQAAAESSSSSSTAAANPMHGAPHNSTDTGPNSSTSSATGASANTQPQYIWATTRTTNIISEPMQDDDGGYHVAVVEGPGTYYIGMVDLLQEWNWRKRMEWVMKVFFALKDRHGVSCLPPASYAERFIERAVLDVFEGMEGYRYSKSNIGPLIVPHSNRYRPEQLRFNPLAPAIDMSAAAGDPYNTDSRFSAVVSAPKDAPKSPGPKESSTNSPAFAVTQI